MLHVESIYENALKILALIAALSASYLPLENWDLSGIGPARQEWRDLRRQPADAVPIVVIPMRDDAAEG